ncbi:Pol protein [Phytophthora palmivora]|uniref:Pol protein n=1 Tax=Phytophthora palmivora TaxID=4796 RepID=A0A2P4XSA0_9STRA|nr:Pol protein [Phytophthora palmivora]
MDLAVKFEDFVSTESFLVLDVDKYDLILDMPWLGKLIAKRVGLPRRQVPTLRVVAPYDAESRRAVRTSTVAVPDATDQAGNIGPQAAEAVEEDAESASGVGNIVPRGVEKTEKTEKMNESAACISIASNRVPHRVKKTRTRAEVLLSTSRVDNQVPHSESEIPPVRPVEDQYNIFDGVSGRQVKAGVAHLETLPEVPALLILEELSMKDFLAELNAGEIAEMAGVAHLETLPEVPALLILEELSMKDFLAELNAGEIAEMVILKPETSPED